MGKLHDKIAVITGGTGGIGKSTAIAFLKEGAKVVLVDLFDDSLRTTKEELESYGEVITVQADVTKEKDVKNYVEKTVEQFEKIDILFNNAGITGSKNIIIDTPVEDFDNVLAINTRGCRFNKNSSVRSIQAQCTCQFHPPISSQYRNDAQN